MTFDRNAILTPTPEQKAEDAEIQAQNAERLSPLVTESVAQAQYKAAIGMEIAARENIRQAFEMIAESQFWQGEFWQAANTSEDPVKVAEYERFSHAFGKLDHPLCLCGPRQVPAPGSAKGRTLPARRDIQTVYCAGQGKEIRFIQCDVCNQLFAQTV